MHTREKEILFIYMMDGEYSKTTNPSDLGYKLVAQPIYRHDGEFHGYGQERFIPPQNTRWIEPRNYRNHNAYYHDFGYYYTKDLEDNDLNQDCASIPEYVNNIRIPCDSILHNFIRAKNSYSIPFPKHITSINFTKLFEVYPDNDDGNRELAKLFRTLPSHIKNVNTTNANLRGITHERERVADVEVSEERLKKLLNHLPFSVKTITVPGKPPIKLNPYRIANNYFPDSYRDICEAAKDNFVTDHKTELLNQTRAIFADYTKRDDLWPGFTLFFTHPLRKHVDAVNACLKEDHPNEVQSFDSLYTSIQRIKDDSIARGDFNPTGSFARRIHYIELLREQVLENEEKIREKHSSSRKI